VICVRALPNTVTAGDPIWFMQSKPSANSPMIRNIRHESLVSLSSSNFIALLDILSPSMWNEENRLPALWGTLLKVSYSAGFNKGYNQPFFFPEAGTLLD
jgi:hypothetical protein